MAEGSRIHPILRESAVRVGSAPYVDAPDALDATREKNRQAAVRSFEHSMLADRIPLSRSLP